MTTAGEDKCYVVVQGQRVWIETGEKPPSLAVKEGEALKRILMGPATSAQAEAHMEQLCKHSNAVRA